jgi:hypothetical protein
MKMGRPSLKMAKGLSPPCVADDHNCTVLEMFWAKIRLSTPCCGISIVVGMLKGGS